MQEPNVITEWHDEKLNFTLQVYAYRKVTDAEMRSALVFWMQNTRHKKIPKNKTGKVITIHGYKD